MCHSITWYYALCQHPDPEAASLIACHRAFQTGYECTEEHQKTTQFPLIGSCLTCKLDKLMQRQSISREWRRGNLSSALNDAFQYTDGDSWTIDDSEAEELDMETLTSQSPSSSTSRVENRETRASFHRGPARTPTIVQPSSPHVSSVALVEYADDFADDEDEANSQPVQEPQTRSSRTWRSWIPLPTRLVRNQQTPTYLAFITDENMSDTEPLLPTSKPKKYHQTWRSWIPLPVRKVYGQ